MAAIFPSRPSVVTEGERIRYLPVRSFPSDFYDYNLDRGVCSPHKNGVDRTGIVSRDTKPNRVFDGHFIATFSCRVRVAPDCLEGLNDTRNVPRATRKNCVLRRFRWNASGGEHGSAAFERNCFVSFMIPFVTFRDQPSLGDSLLNIKGDFSKFHSFPF